MKCRAPLSHILGRGRLDAGGNGDIYSAAKASRENLVLFPSSLEVFARHVVADETHVAYLFISAYPREVSLGWLDSLVSRLGGAQVSLHIEPVDPQVAATHLRRQLARFESTRRIEENRGRIADPGLDLSTADAHDLAARVAAGTDRLFKVGLYITVSAESQESLARAIAKARAACSSMLATAHPATFRQLDGLVSALPIGLDRLSRRRTFDTAALAASFPFSSPESAVTTGTFIGRNAKGSGLVFFDRFARENYNSVTLAKSGAGKSYLAKLEVLRSLYTGTRVFVVDPEDEYGRLCSHVGGTRIAIGESGASLNPLDLTAEPDVLARRALFTRSLAALLLAETLSAAAQAALDQGVADAYAKAGITNDPSTHIRPAPTLSDVVEALGSAGSLGNRQASLLAAKLAPYGSGAQAHVFSGTTTARADGQLVVFSLATVPEELKAAATLLTLDAIWRAVNALALSTPKLVTIDEGWSLMSHEAGARFLFRLAKSARKRHCGLSVFTQDTGDLLGSDLGRAVVTNSATQILLSQSPQGLAAVADAFHLTEGERAYLQGASVGKGLLMGSAEHVAFRAIASGEEHALITTDPKELSAR